MDADSAYQRHQIALRLSRRFQVRLVGEGVLVGVAVGAVITLYRLALGGAEGLLRQVTAAAAGTWWQMALWAAAVALMWLAVSWLVRRVPSTAGSGIPQVDVEVAGRLDMPWARTLAAKFAEGVLVAFSGLSMGREGPSVLLGSMSAKGVSRILGRKRGEERLLVTCGAAAGMSAAFHAPLTGVLFALEEIHKEFSAPLIISVMCSSVAADYLTSQALGITPVLALAFAHDLPHASYALVVVLGTLCGCAGALHNRGMFLAQRVFAHVKGSLPYARLAVPFALAACAAFAWPELMCGGDAIIERLLEPQGLTFGLLAALLLGKYAFTAVCFGSGAPGGTLLPLVVMGGLFGGLFALAAGTAFGLPSTFFANWVALGVAGLFSGVVRAPVTAVVLVFELTGSLDALLSASIVSVVAYVCANLLKSAPFYERLVEGLLAGTEKASGATASRSAQSGEKTLHTVHVGSASQLEGMRVCDVPWPDGVRLMTVERAGTEIIPTGQTRLLAFDELLVMMRESVSADAMLKLRLMCGGRLDEER